MLLLGNAGSGKSTLARQLAARDSVPRLSLDDVAFAGGTQRRTLADSVREVRQFMHREPSWIIEGCYADILGAVHAHAEILLFLNPGIEACVAHCRARPWEPDKFASRAEQDARLENLIAWVQAYDTREDEYGLRQHRALFDAFAGGKREFVQPQAYAHAGALDTLLVRNGNEQGVARG